MGEIPWAFFLIFILGRKAALLGAFLHGRVVDVYFDILSVVAEGFAEDGETAHMFRVVIHGETEAETAAIVQVEAVYGYIRDF